MGKMTRNIISGSTWTVKLASNITINIYLKIFNRGFHNSAISWITILNIKQTSDSHVYISCFLE